MRAAARSESPAPHMTGDDYPIFLAKGMPMTIVAALLMSAVMSPVCAAGLSADGDPAMTAYRDALIVQLDKLEAALPQMSQSADAAAERLLAGGNLYAAGREPFVIEAYVRAGGMMMVSKYGEEAKLAANDVMLVGAWTNADESAVEACKRAKAAGSYVVLFSPAFEDRDAPLAALCDDHIVNHVEGDGLAVAVGGGRRVGSTSGLFNVTALWTYTAELVGSLTRGGKMPVMWQSVVVPGGRERNGRYRQGDDATKWRFHEDMTIPPQPPGRLGQLYVDGIRRQVAGLRGPVLEQIAAASAKMAECVRAGGAVHVQTVSHFTTFEVKSPLVPTWVKADYEARLVRAVGPEQLAAAMKPGDVFFQLGYYWVAVRFEVDTGYVEAVRKKKGTSVIALCHAPYAPLNGPQPDFLIDAQWEYGDAVVLVPGYDVKMLPCSAVLQTAAFWTVVAKTESLLAGRQTDME